MSKLDLNALTIHYTQTGKGRDIVLLHGWGQNRVMMAPIQEHFSNRFRVTNIDFPGFGDSALPIEPWGVKEYTEFLRHLCVKLEISEPILIAHSFGARVAIMYASLYPTHKLILTGAAGLRPKRGIAYYSRVYTYKTLKRVVKLRPFVHYEESLKKHFGSSDYKSAAGVMRSSFVKIVNEDLRPLLPLIKIPVLLIWGDKDEATPLWMGKIMEKEFPDAGLVLFEGDDHFAYWHQIDRFNHIIDAFLKEDEVHS